MFITALGQLNNCFHHNSNFAILEDLHRENLIDQTTFYDLSFAVALACQVRLWHCMRLNSQNDSLAVHQEDFCCSVELNPFHAVVATKHELVRFLSTILHILLMKDQISNLNNLFNKNDIWPELTVKMYMGLYEEVVDDGERYLRGRSIETGNDLIVMHYLNAAYKHKEKDSRARALSTTRLGRCYGTSSSQSSLSSETVLNAKSNFSLDIIVKQSNWVVEILRQVSSDPNCKLQFSLSGNATLCSHFLAEKGSLNASEKHF